MTMKGFLPLRIIGLLFVLSFFGAAARARFGGGTGEPDDPWLIHTAEQMNAIGADPNLWDRHFRLMADIDLSAYDGQDGRPAFNIIAPDGDQTTWSHEGTPFIGTFDGGDHVIRNLKIVGDFYLGLFGRLGADARVSNLGIVDCAVTGTKNHIGALAGESSGLVTDCYSTGAVGGSTWVGGLIGDQRLGSRLLRSYSTCDVTGATDVGGFVGSNHGSIIRAFATGAVHSGRCAGGLAGNNYNHIIGCYSTGRVDGAELAGGLVGENRSLIVNCYSSGRVSGWKYVGALIGKNIPDYVVANCYSSGKASGDKETFGLIGESDWQGSVTGCFYDPTGVRTDQMQSMQTYLDAGWDFVGETANGLHEFWQMPEGGGYPVLSFSHGPALADLVGQGTAQDPYLISAPADLAAMLYQDPRAWYRLAGDIDLSGVTWSMSVIPEFQGIFDGRGHAIGHLSISAGSRLGLFGSLGGQVRDLEVLDANIVGEDAVGILAATTRYAEITRCRSTGRVVGWSNVGGFVGLNDRSWIYSCCSEASVRGEEAVGGFVGWNLISMVSDCYSRGAVRGDLGVGGFIGYNDGSVSGCYSTGAVTGRDPYDYVAGFIGANGEGPISSCFWDVEASGLSIGDAATGLKTAQMQDLDTYLRAGWDFIGETANGTEDIWWIDEGKDYPRLWWEIAGDRSANAVNSD